MRLNTAKKKKCLRISHPGWTNRSASLSIRTFNIFLSSHLTSIRWIFIFFLFFIIYYCALTFNLCWLKQKKWNNFIQFFFSTITYFVYVFSCSSVYLKKNIREKLSINFAYAAFMQALIKLIKKKKNCRIKKSDLL